MVKLTDIAPVRVPVEIDRGGTTVTLDVGAVSAGAIASLIMRFPEIQKLTDGEALTLPAISKLADPAIAAIIAAACGEAGDPAAEESAAAFGAEDQLAILEAAIRLTMPRGLGPFVEKLTAIVAGVSDREGEAEKAA